MLSSRAKYATRAILDLALNYEEGPVQLQHLAERQNIPPKYLEQIMMILKLSGFVSSQKGPGGGYRLAKPPHGITLGAVTRALDGPIAPMSCVSVSGFAECGCPNPDTCGLRTVWKEARNSLADVLDGTTFSDICRRHILQAPAMAEVCDCAI